jgi:hypothetical protein
MLERIRNCHSGIKIDYFLGSDLKLSEKPDPDPEQ